MLHKETVAESTLELLRLVYFEDADPQQDPIDLLNVTWLEVKASLRDHVRNYTRSILE